MNTPKSNILMRGAVCLLFLAGCATAQVKPGGAVTCTIEPERKILAADTPESVVVKVALNGITAEATHRTAVNLAIVIDRSGSMTGTKIQRAKEAAIAAISRLDERDIVSVIVFDDTIQTLVPARRVRDKAAIANTIRAVQAGGSTAIFGAVSQAASEIRKNAGGDRVNRILLLSDGQANVGPSSPTELGRLGAALVKESVSVSTIGLGLDYNEDLMISLSGKSDGNTYFVENSDDLPRVFSAELGDVLSVVAKDVKLRVKFKNGATPVELIGRDGRIEHNTVTVDFNQLYGNQQKFVLIRTEFTPGEESETRNFAEASVDYCTLNSAVVSKFSTSSSVTFSKSMKRVDASVNVDVVKDAIYNENAVGLENAIRRSDIGDLKEAGKLVSGNVSRTRAASVRYNIPELETEAQRQDALAADIKLAPPPPPMRKAMMTDNYQIMNQQPTK